MTRAEQAALEAYPVHSVLIHPARRGGYYADNHLREGFIKGYEQAEKHTLRKVEKWLAEIHRVCDITDENGYRIELRDLTALLEKAMEVE